MKTKQYTPDKLKRIAAVLGKLNENDKINFSSKVKAEGQQTETKSIFLDMLNIKPKQKSGILRDYRKFFNTVVAFVKGTLNNIQTVELQVEKEGVEAEQAKLGDIVKTFLSKLPRAYRDRIQDGQIKMQEIEHIAPAPAVPEPVAQKPNPLRPHNVARDIAKHAARLKPKEEKPEVSPRHPAANQKNKKKEPNKAGKVVAPKAEKEIKSTGYDGIVAHVRRTRNQKAPDHNEQPGLNLEKWKDKYQPKNNPKEGPKRWR